MSNLVLYRKYRPLKFDSVVNQEHIKTTLSNAVANNRVGHAYLFTGPRGVGKTTLARIFARAINCTNRQGSEPCNECDLCKQFLNNSSLDLLEIDAASHTGVDNIRELIDHLQFAPTMAAYKVIIVDEVHMLSKGAFNALLKTLEEPPLHAVFILATTEINKVPATIISRTQKFDFKKVGIIDLSKLLKFVANDANVKVSDGALMEIAAAADGSFRDGLSLLDQVISYADGEVSEELVERVLGLTGIKTTAKFLDLIIENRTQEAVSFITELSYAGRDLYQFGKDFLEYLRKVLLVKVGATSNFGFTGEVHDNLKKQAQALGLVKLTKVIQIFQKAESELKWTAVQSLPLELAAVEAASEKESSAVLADNITDLAYTVAHKLPSPQANLNPDKDNPEELNRIINSWPQILEKLKEYNHSLISSLKLATPVAIEGKELILVFPYKFHKDSIEARKNRIVVDQVIEEVTGLKLMVKPVNNKEWTEDVGEIKNLIVDNDNPVDPGKNDDNKKNELVESALKIFGGEVES